MSTALMSSQEQQAWAKGCGRCQFGLLHPPDASGFLADTRRAQFENGELSFCDCAAGKAYAAFLSYKHASMEVEIAEARRAADARRRERIFANAGVPPRYAEFTLQSYIELAAGLPGKDTAIGVVRYYLDNGQAYDGTRTYPGLFFWGEPGVGKTGLLSPLFMHLLRNGKSGVWISYPDLMAALRSFEDGNVEERMAELQRTDILFIDDFGDPDSQRAASDYSRDTIFRIIDHRLTHQLPMFITSNLGPGAVVDQFHQRIARRINEACLAVRVTGKPLGRSQPLGRAA